MRADGAVLLDPGSLSSVDIASLKDRSPFGSDGTFSGITIAREASGLQVLDFDPTTPSYVEFTAPQLNFISEPFSITLWLKPETLTNWQQVLSRGRQNVDGWYLESDAAGLISFFSNQAGARQGSTLANGTLVNGTWIMIGIVRNGASVRMYANGLDTTDTAGNHVDPVTSSRSLLLGVSYDKIALPYNGMEALIGVTARAVSAGEILQEYQAQKRFFR